MVAINGLIDLLPAWMCTVCCLPNFWSNFQINVIGKDILLPKLFWPNVGKNCSSDREKLLKFKAEGREFVFFLRSLEQSIQTVKDKGNFC